ncbi:MAG: ATP synthase F1 subunit delta [Clostridia bacterium]|nr:ATP synthase F1 subunit delta [Clostridia bacterium]
MSEARIARRYAQAYFELMAEKGLLDRAEEDLKAVVDLAQEVPEFARLLNHRGIPAAEKKDLLRRLFAAQVSPLTLNFLLLLCDRRREALLPAIHRHFGALVLEARGVVEVEVRAAVSLSEEQIQALQASLSRVTGRAVHLRQRLEPGLLGGLVVKVGDRVFDGSIAGRLNRLKEHIKGMRIEELRGDRAG